MQYVWQHFINVIVNHSLLVKSEKPWLIHLYFNKNTHCSVTLCMDESLFPSLPKGEQFAKKAELAACHAQKSKLHIFTQTTPEAVPAWIQAISMECSSALIANHHH